MMKRGSLSCSGWKFSSISGNSIAGVSLRLGDIARKLAKFTAIKILIIIDFSLTVKAATLMLLSGHGSTISSAKRGNSGSTYNLVLFGLRKTCVHFMKILTVYTLNSHLITLKAHNHKMFVF